MKMKKAREETLAVDPAFSLVVDVFATTTKSVAEMGKDSVRVPEGQWQNISR
jgi:hypothetical protein